MTTLDATDSIGVQADAADPKKRRGLLPVLAVLGVLLVGGGVTYALLPAGNDAEIDDATLVTVKQGPLTISVSETGTIEAAQQTTIKSQVEGQRTILRLVEEGTRVKKGDLLIELDVSELRDRYVTTEIKVRNDESDLIQAQEELAVKENQARADVSAAELDFRFAVEDKKKYEEGDFPKEKAEAENKVFIAREELRRSQEKRRGSERLHEEEFISRSEFEADQLSERKNELNLEVAIRSLELLEGWTHRRKLDEFKSDIVQKEMALERAKRKAKADMAQAEAKLAARQAELRREQLRLAHLGSQIALGTIYSPVDAMVVHAGQDDWRSSGPLEVGTQVRQRQELLKLPTDRDRVAEVSIRESDLDKLEIGMRARVTVDALPGRTFWGTLERIAPLPDSRRSFMSPDSKVYPARIRIEGENDQLRSGMSCRVEIVVERFDSAVYVPVQTVTRVEGETVVHVQTDGGVLERRVVEVGPDDNMHVVILEGLREGERVSLTPPLEETEIDDRIEEEPAAEATVIEVPTTRPTTQPATEATPATEAMPVTEATPATRPAGG
jgi:HlyD family secretion protein